MNVRRLLIGSLMASASASAAEVPVPAPPPPTEAPRDSVALPSTRAPEPRPDPNAVKVRIGGEYELRQSVFTDLPLRSVGGSPRALGQTTRLYHWLRLRALVLFATRAELRAEADVPRGMIYGQEPNEVFETGTDFTRVRPLGVHVRMLRLTLRQRAFELTMGHTTLQRGLGLVDADGDQPRYFGTPERPATFERLEVLSGSVESSVRVGASADVQLYDRRFLHLQRSDQLVRAGLSVDFTPSPRTRLSLLARYEALGRAGGGGGAQTVLLDLSGHSRAHLPGRAGELFVAYEGAYRVGFIEEPTAFAAGKEQTVSALAFAARAGFALERTQDLRRFAHLVASLEWGVASGDEDPTDDAVHRFSMNPNHGVGLILFSEVLRFKTARAQAELLAQDWYGAAARRDLSTRGGVAGATYLNPVMLMRPRADLTLKLGVVVASTTGSFVDPSRLGEGKRSNFDGGSPAGRSLGTELDAGAELSLPLRSPTTVRCSIEGAVAFPGSAFDDGEGRSLGTQALATVGVGLTF